MQVEIAENIDPEQEKAILRASTQSLRSAQKASKPTAIWLVARNSEQSVVGGCRCGFWKGWFSLRALWVDPKERGQGLGSKLLAEAEVQARAKGALGIEVSLYALQGPDFFLKRGFEAVARLPGESEGDEMVWLVNNFRRLPAKQPAKSGPRRAKREARKTGSVKARSTKTK